MKNRNFQDIKVGDIVVVSDVNSRTENKLFEITKVTKTTFTAGNSLFNRACGKLRGSSHNPWIQISAWIPTEDQKQAIEQENKIYKLRCKAKFLLKQANDSVNNLSEDALTELIRDVYPYITDPYITKT